MALVEMVMPKMGESIMEATILSWLKQEGDEILQDESILEVATDKVDTEVPSIYSGIVKKILAKDGDIVEIGKPIAVIETDEELKHPLGLDDLPDDFEHPADSEIDTVTNLSESHFDGFNQLSRPEHDRFYSPLVRNIAKQENVSQEELDLIPGTGKKNRVTKNDIVSYLKKKGSGIPTTEKKITSKSEMVIPEPVKLVDNGEDEIIEMDRIRRIISDRMIESKQTSAHVSSFVEADVTNIIKWRDKVRNDFLSEHKVKLTYTPIIIEAVVKAIKDYPMVNISIVDNKIIKKKSINIGVAVALPDNNLIVPVIKNAEQLSLIGLASHVNDIARRARENELKPDELSEGTYTVTNVGTFGSMMGTPIIMQPQVAILAIGAIVKKPAVIETPSGDTIGIRSKMFLSHTYDHRVVDGALGGMFVRRVADYLEQFDTDRNF
ncbi:dihydrolipoamide acetyltransferase family protein [Bacteroidota bacterium]